MSVKEKNFLSSTVEATSASVSLHATEKRAGRIRVLFLWRRSGSMDCLLVSRRFKFPGKPKGTNRVCGDSSSFLAPIPESNHTHLGACNIPVKINGLPQVGHPARDESLQLGGFLVDTLSHERLQVRELCDACM